MIIYQIRANTMSVTGGVLESLSRQVKKKMFFFTLRCDYITATSSFFCIYILPIYRERERERERESVCVVYVYTYTTYSHTSIFIYIYIYRERERERERASARVFQS